MKVKIVGTQFAKALAEGLMTDDVCQIVHDPTNPYDKNALKVLYNNEHLGFIGKGTDLYDLDRASFPMEATVVDFLRKTPGDKFKNHKEGTIVSVTLEIENVVELLEENDVTSFNEDVVINFNEETHTYTYNGKVLTGATTYIKKFIKPFDSDEIAGRCVRFWDVPKSTILDAWEIERVLAEQFGTAIHKAIEHEELYSSHIKPKKNERCFKIKHPMIQKIVKEFYELIDSLGHKGDVIPEALVSNVEEGHCGLIDRLLIVNAKEKICRVQDYKVNHSFDTYGQVEFVNLPHGFSLPPTKLAKTALQLKFYAKMLEKDGWTVEGADVFVYADKWRHYEADMLTGLNIVTGKIEY